MPFSWGILSWTPLPQRHFFPAGLGRSRRIKLKDTHPERVQGNKRSLWVTLAALPPGGQRTDPVGPTEPPWGDKAATHPVGQPVSAMLPADALHTSDGDQELLLELELEFWPCLLAAVVQLTSLMLE